MEERQQDPLIEEALRWLVLLRDDQATEADREDFVAWLARGPGYAAAWRRAQYVWSHASTLERALGDRRSAVEMRRTVPAVWETAPRKTEVLSRRRWMRAAAAAAVVVGSGGYLLSHPALFASRRTGIGERKSFTLADGSTVELGSASALSVAYDDVARRVTLHAGEAFFTVAQDVARPFLVDAAKGQTQALGTAFDVKRNGDFVSVAVTEHVVAVSVDNRGSTTVAQGQQVRYGPSGFNVVERADLHAVEAWRQDRLIFQDAPLATVVGELNRYRHGDIIITDNRLRTMTVTAVFDTRQTDAALQTIGSTLPVRVRKLTDLLVLLSAAS